MAAQQAKQQKILLSNVRLSYCYVHQKGVFEGKESDKYECTMLLSKDDEEMSESIRKKCVKALVDKYGSKDKIPAPLKKMVTKDKWGDSDKCFFRDGDSTESEAHHGHWAVKGANKQKPTLLDKAKNPTDEDSGLIYSGSFADVMLSIWIQDNQWGKRINANLNGVRHRNHGDPLSGGGGKASADDFADLDDDDVDDDDDVEEFGEEDI